MLATLVIKIGIGATIIVASAITFLELNQLRRKIQNKL